MSFLRRYFGHAGPFAVIAALGLVFALLSLSAVGCGRANIDDTFDGGRTDVGGDGGIDTGCPPGTFCIDGGPDTPDGKVLLSINLEPAITTLPMGSTALFSARGFYSDGSTSDVTDSATWTSNDPSVVRVDKPGVVASVGVGTARIRATVGVVFGEADVIVKSAAITDLQLSPPFADLPVGGTQRFVATAFFGDGTKVDVSGGCKWALDGPYAKVDITGLVAGVSPGGGALSASIFGRTAFAKVSVTGRTLKSLEIAPFAPTAPIKSTVVFTATALYTDGTKADVTSTSTWTSTDTTVASIISSGAAGGNATTLKGGTSGISATFSGTTAFTTLTVTSSTLTGVSVSPTAATTSPGGTITLKATANFADGTSLDVTGSASWSTSDASLAVVASGLVTGVAPGSATITAAFSGFSGTSAITISPAVLVSVSCGPDPLTVPLGITGALKATGTYAGGVTRDVTKDVGWSTDDAKIAVVDTSGVVTPLAIGATKAHAKIAGIEGVCAVVVNKASIARINLAPSPLTMVQGTKQLSTATAQYSDGTTVDVTATCTWSVADAKIGSVSNAAGSQGLVTAVGVGGSTLSCTFGGITGTATLTVSGPTLSQVVVSPIAPTCLVGDTIQFFANAITTSGTSSNVTVAASWSSDTPTIVAFAGAPGRFRCLAAGTAHVSATYGGLTGSTPVTVSSAVLTSIQVDPIDATLAVGDNQQYQAVAIYADGTSVNVTGMATWLSTDPSVASIGTGGPTRGRATGLKAGTTTIQATYKGVTGSTKLTVSAATVVSISINPAVRSVPVGTVFNYTAQAIYSDGTSKDVTAAATWLSTSTITAQVSNAIGSKGRATALAAGTTTIQATYSGVTGTASLTVTSATLVSVQVTPFTASVASGTPIQYRADAIYSDGTSGDVTGAATWLSTVPSVANVSDAGGSKGRVTTIKAGTTTLRATYKGTSGEATLTVTSATLTNVQITPFKPTIPVGYGIRLTATGIYSDGTKADLTELATWTSGTTSVAAVSDAAGSKGRVSTLSAGSATISATWAGVVGTDVVTVSSATLSSISVTPNPADVAVSGSTSLSALGTFSDGSTLDVTDRVTWSSSDTKVADVSNAGDTTGVVFGFAPGTVTITAQRGAIKGTATANVK